MKQVLHWNKRDDRENILRLLLSEKVIGGNSDTVPGLYTLATPEGKRQLDRIKERSEQPYILLVSSFEKARSFLDPAHIQNLEQLAQKYWPGPITLIGRAQADIPAYIAPSGTVALRVPNHPGLLEILEQVPALFSTSANTAGEPVPVSAQVIDQTIKDHINALVVSDTTGVSKRAPSTIVDCTGKQLRVVRPGQYSLQELQQVISSRYTDKKLSKN